MQALDQVDLHGDRAAVIFIDLDGFKRVNDSLGHHAGDLLLQEVARRFTDCIRRGDTLSRRGGDEFLLLATSLNEAQDAVKAARQLLACLRKPFLILGHEVFDSASVGIAVYPDDAGGLDTLQRNADAATYHAKAKGRGRIECFTPEMTDAAHGRFPMEGALRRALENSEFRLHYRLKVDARSFEPKAVEALMRCQHPQCGQLPPSAFLDVAVECGLVRELDESILREACQQAAEWQRQGLEPLRLAVNVSAPQFERDDLASVVAAALADSGFEARWLELEVTESFVMRDLEATLAQFRRLRDLGVRLAMDDFGTGYSSLAHLQRLPFATLKIDRSVVSPLGKDRASSVLVEAMVDLAHKLGLQVIAEGVETPEQLAVLRAVGCDLIQGFLTGEPLAPDELATRLARRDE